MLELIKVAQKPAGTSAEMWLLVCSEELTDAARSQYIDLKDVDFGGKITSGTTIKLTENGEPIIYGPQLDEVLEEKYLTARKIIDTFREIIMEGKIEYGIGEGQLISAIEYVSYVFAVLYELPKYRADALKRFKYVHVLFWVSGQTL